MRGEFSILDAGFAYRFCGRRYYAWPARDPASRLATLEADVASTYHVAEMDIRVVICREDFARTIARGCKTAEELVRKDLAAFDLEICFARIDSWLRSGLDDDPEAPKKLPPVDLLIRNLPQRPRENLAILARRMGATVMQKQQ